VEPDLAREFYGQLRPISDKFVPEALAVSGFSREETLAFPEPEGVMRSFAAWIASVGGGRPMFISDNNGFDWQFINWYFHHFTGASTRRSTTRGPTSSRAGCGRRHSGSAAV
jgi:hypothetical protein